MAFSLFSKAFAADSMTKTTHAGAGLSIILGGLTLSQWQSVIAIAGIIVGTLVSVFTAWVNWKHKRRSWEDGD